MSKYTIARSPGDGVGKEVLEATKICFDALKLDATYPHGDIGWEFWCNEGDAFPERTVELLRNCNAAMFGAITSKPVKDAEHELVPALQGKGLVYRSPIVRMRQMFDLYNCLRPCKAYAGNPLNYKEGIDLVIFRENTEDLYSGVEFNPVPEELSAVLAKLSKPFAHFAKLPGERVRRHLQDQHEARLRADHPRQPSSTPRSSATRRSPSSTRPTWCGRPKACSWRLASASPRTTPASRWTTPTSTPSACGCSRTRRTMACSLPPTCSATSSATCAAQMVGGLGFGCSGNIGDKLAVFEPSHGSAPKYTGQYKVNPIATILAGR